MPFRVAVVLVLTLWLAPQAAALWGVDLCTAECSDEDSGIPCPPLCASCSCTPNAPRLAPTLFALADARAWHPVSTWWSETTMHQDGVPTDVFHPPRA